MSFTKKSHRIVYLWVCIFVGMSLLSIGTALANSSPLDQPDKMSSKSKSRLSQQERKSLEQRKKTLEDAVKTYTQSLATPLISKGCSEMVPRRILIEYSLILDCIVEFSKAAHLGPHCPTLLTYQDKNCYKKKVRVYYNVTNGGKVQFYRIIGPTPEDSLHDPGLDHCFNKYRKLRLEKDKVKAELFETQILLKKVSDELRK